ncbi:hypothetical protein As57867_001688, partial [Aphanomyces stellatus]
MSAASRGSRVHHVRRTPSPFFTTSSGIVGINLNEPTEFLAPKLEEAHVSKPTDNNQLEESKLVKFMYQTTTSGIGDGIERRESPMTQRMDKFIVKKEIEQSGLVKIRSVNVISPEEVLARTKADILAVDLTKSAVDTKPIAVPRQEHPMYTTSTRVVGEEKGAIQVTTERIVKPGTFTNSFNGFRYRDYGLNTAVTNGYFVWLAQPSLTNNLYWAHYNTTGTESCLIDIANVKLSTTGHGNLNLLAQDAIMRKNYANVAQSQPTFQPGYARRVLFTELNTVHQAILSIRSSPNQWWFDAQYCWVDFKQTWDVAHTAARSLRCRQRYQDNGASYIEGLLRNIDWHGFLGICGDWWNEAVAAELLRTPAGTQWLADRPSASLQFDVDDEVAFWQSWNITRYDLQWQNKRVIAITESILVENALAIQTSVPLKAISPARASWTSAILFWNLMNDLWMPYFYNVSLVRGAPNHMDVAGMPMASMFGLEDANGAFSQQTGVFYANLGPFGSVDALYVPLPPSLLTLYTMLRNIMYQLLSATPTFYRVMDGTSGFIFTPLPPVFMVGDLVYFGGNPLCMTNGPTLYPQSQFSFEDACGSQSQLTFSASNHAILFALLVSGATQLDSICVFQSSIGCTQALSQALVVVFDFRSQLTDLRAIANQATSDAPPIELFQYAQNTTDNSWLMLHQPLLSSDVNWSFFGWLALFDWIQGTREVIRFEGDATTLVLISEVSPPVVLATSNDNQSNSTILYDLLLYTTIASAFVGIGCIFYTFVHGFRISGRNLFLFNRVAGSVWIGRPLLLVRALVASIVLGTCQDQLMMLPDGGYSKFTAAPRSIWSSMVVAGEATWVSYVIGDVLLVSMHASSAKVIAPVASTLAWLAIVILDYAFPVTFTAQLNRKCTADDTYRFLNCQSGLIQVGSWPRIAIVLWLQVGSLVMTTFTLCLFQHRHQWDRVQSKPSLVLHGAAAAFLCQQTIDDRVGTWQLDDATLLLCGLVSFSWGRLSYIFDIKSWVILDAKHAVRTHERVALSLEKTIPINKAWGATALVAPRNGPTTARHPRRRVVIFGLIYVLLSTVGSVSFIVLSTVNFANDFYWVTFNMTGHHVAIADWFNENVMLSRNLSAFRLDEPRWSSMDTDFSGPTLQVRSSPWLAPRLQFEALTGVLP